MVTPGAGTSLPVTGSQTQLLVSSPLVLLLLGGFLVLVAGRRRAEHRS